jgi:hypothetical protein
MSRKEINIVATIFIVSFLGLQCRTHKNQSRYFFNGMKPSYPDIKIGSNSYFLKSFGISSKATTIRSAQYWKLSCGNALFYLSGYLRMLNDSIIFIPIDYNPNVEKIPTYKLFDFNARINNSWKIYYNKETKPTMGDSITYLGGKIIYRDTLFQYSIVPFFLNRKHDGYQEFGPTLKLEVSLKNGITKITREGIGLHNGIEYQAELFPKQRFINNLGNAAEL